MTLGMEFSAWAYTMGKALKELEQAADFILELNAGGTATGTGVNTPQGFAGEVVAEISRFTGYNFRKSENLPGIITLSSSCPACTEIFTDCCAPMTEWHIMFMASAIDGFIFPGMMEEPC